MIIKTKNNNLLFRIRMKNRERKIGPKFGDKDHNKLDNQFRPKLYEDQIELISSR